MSVHSSQSRDCLVSVRCVVADHYQAEPVAGLDPLVSDFTGYNIRKVPIIRCVMSEPFHSVIGRDDIILLYPVSGCSAAPWLASAPVSTCTESSPTSTCRCRATWHAGTRAGGSLSCFVAVCVLSEPDGDIESGGCTDWRPASIVPSTSPWARLELVRELTRAHQIHVQGRAAVQHVYKAVVVTGLPMYGYHPRQHSFVKIYLYNPHLVRRAAELLQVRAS